MRYVDEFRQVEISKTLVEKIHKYCHKFNEKINIMEVCGTHTMSIYKNGIDKILPSNINLLSGPGCPVCVTDISFIDSAIELSLNKNIIICTFSDMLRVPGSYSSLNIEKSKGANIVGVYSPLDALGIAKKNKDKEVIFLGVGFETTIPIIGLAIKTAYKNNINNFSVLPSLKTMPNTMKKLILDKEVNIDGFICPGHVGAVIGNNVFNNLAKENKVSMTMSGFEHSDILYSILKLIEMIVNKDYKCINEYSRVVTQSGNEKAKHIIKEVFDVNSVYWRGLGIIEDTGLIINDKYKDYDAINKFNIEFKYNTTNNNCLCKDILKGIKKPIDCKLFKNKCTPGSPIGPCMVSSEGSCANFYKYSN